MAVASIYDLLLVPFAKRDHDWEKFFFSALPQSNLKLLSHEPKVGPDSWPYLFVEVAASGDEPFSDIAKWLGSQGIGLAINPQKDMPDYVFSYGMIWNFLERNEFLTPSEQRASGQFEVQPNQTLWVGEPSKSYLPEYVRAVLRQFFVDQGVLKPMVAMVSEDQKTFDLCFSLESLRMPPANEHQGIAEAISWFLPAHYSIALVSEKLTGQFFNL